MPSLHPYNFCRKFLFCLVSILMMMVILHIDTEYAVIEKRKHAKGIEVIQTNEIVKESTQCFTLAGQEPSYYPTSLANSGSN